MKLFDVTLVTHLVRPPITVSVIETLSLERGEVSVDGFRAFDVPERRRRRRRRRRRLRRLRRRLASNNHSIVVFPVLVLVLVHRALGNATQILFTIRGRHRYPSVRRRGRDLERFFGNAHDVPRGVIADECVVRARVRARDGEGDGEDARERSSRRHERRRDADADARADECGVDVGTNWNECARVKAVG